MTFTCALCADQVDDVEAHLEQLHPDDFEPIQTWPDGQVVVIDTTITPEEFHG